MIYSRFFISLFLIFNLFSSFAFAARRQFKCDELLGDNNPVLQKMLKDANATGYYYFMDYENGDPGPKTTQWFFRNATNRWFKLFLLISPHTAMYLNAREFQNEKYPILYEQFIEDVKKTHPEVNEYKARDYLIYLSELCEPVHFTQCQAIIEKFKIRFNGKKTQHSITWAEETLSAKRENREVEMKNIFSHSPVLKDLIAFRNNHKSVAVAFTAMGLGDESVQLEAKELRYFIEISFKDYPAEICVLLTENSRARSAAHLTALNSILAYARNQVKLAGEFLEKNPNTALPKEISLTNNEIKFISQLGSENDIPTLDIIRTKARPGVQLPTTGPFAHDHSHPISAIVKKHNGVVHHYDVHGNPEQASMPCCDAEQAMRYILSR